MGRSISLFSNYHQKENATTNYCGLVMKLVYEANPGAFQEVLNTIVETELNVLPSFEQQVRKTKCIPDLCITQESYRVLFETKVKDWFYENQIDRLLGVFKENPKDNNILILLTDEYKLDTERKLSKTISAIADYATRNDTRIKVSLITFEDFLGAVCKAVKENVSEESFINSVLEEFEDYLNFSGCLPIWKNRLDVVNCAKSLDIVEKGLYTCPIKKGSYSHKRSKWFGAYANKSVKYLCEIRAIVECKGPEVDKCEVVTKNRHEDKDDVLKKLAIQRLLTCPQPDIDDSYYGIRIFILEDRRESKMVKQSKGAMMCSKQYFSVVSENMDDLLEEVAKISW